MGGEVAAGEGSIEDTVLLEEDIDNGGSGGVAFVGDAEWIDNAASAGRRSKGS